MYNVVKFSHLNDNCTRINLEIDLLSEGRRPFHNNGSYVI